MSFTIYLLIRFWGKYVGHDQLGNRYYLERQPYFRKPVPYETLRRFVIYKKGRAEASSVPPQWQQWLTHNCELPTDDYVGHEWEMDHCPNYTGTKLAYYYSPSPSSIACQKSKKCSSWKPE